MKTLLKACIVLLLMLITALQANAQTPPPCPSTVPDNPSISWDSSGCYNMNISGCVYEVCWCSRRVSAIRVDYVVTSIRPLAGGIYCNQYTWEELILLAADRILKDNPAGFDCPTCPSVTLNRYAVMGTCFKMVDLDPGEGEMLAAQICDEPGWCVQGKTICCVDGVPTTVSSGSLFQVNGSCSTESPGTPVSIPVGTEYVINPWPLNTCYYIHTSCDE